MTDREEAAARISDATKRMVRILGAEWVYHPGPDYIGTPCVTVPHGYVIPTDRKDGHE